MNLFLVGQYKSGKDFDIVWEFQGIFDSREKALAAMLTDDYFLTEIELNRTIPHDSVEFPGWIGYRSELG
jgi:hypothetical protein